VELIIGWLLIIVGGLGLNSLGNTRLIKKIADRGYKFNLKNVELLGKKLNADCFNDNIAEHMPMIWNMICVIDHVTLDATAIDLVIKELKERDLIEMMTKEEMYEYKKNHDCKTILEISNKENIQTQNYSTMKLKDGSRILYVHNTRFNDITIIKVEGKASKLSEEEQRNLVLETWKKIGKELDLKYNRENENHTLNFLESTSTEKSDFQKKIFWENFKTEILGQQTAQEEIEKPKIMIK